MDGSAAYKWSGPVPAAYQVCGEDGANCFQRCDTHDLMCADRFLVRDEVAERLDVSEQVDDYAGHRGEAETVPEDEAQNRSFLPVLLGCGAGDDDALGVDHFAHDAAG